MAKSIEQLQQEYAELHQRVLRLCAEPNGERVHQRELGDLQQREMQIVSSLRRAGAPVVEGESARG